MTRDDAWEQAAREGRLADAIEAYVKHYDWVTFPELLRRLEPFTEVRGSFALEIAPNVILWLGMSEQIIDAVQQLQREKRIWPWPSSVFVHLIDGGLLKLPIAKRLPKGGYKKERWLPVTLRVHDPKPGRRTA